MRNRWAEAGCYAADCCFVRFNDNTMMKCIGMDDILCINTDRYMPVPVNQVAAAKINCPKIIREIITGTRNLCLFFQKLKLGTSITRQGILACGQAQLDKS